MGLAPCLVGTRYPTLQAEHQVSTKQGVRPELADAAHQMRPYSKTTRGNIEVNVGVAQN